MHTEIDIRTADGVAPAWLYCPASAGTAGVILYMDGFGVRPAIGEMAARLARHGYYVLVPDIFYRSGPYGPFDAKTAITDPITGPQIRKMIADTTQAMTATDTGFFIQALTEAGASGKIGTTGYCMGGSRALRAANEYPERIAAASSWHGGHLASETHDSPHRHVHNMRARLHIGVAAVDKSFPFEQSAPLAHALREAEIDHIIENFVGCTHGWAIPDHAVFDPNGAERHWKRLLTLFEESLD